jgi:hypothetical protein
MRFTHLPPPLRRGGIAHSLQRYYTAVFRHCLLIFAHRQAYLPVSTHAGTICISSRLADTSRFLTSIPVKALFKQRQHETHASRTRKGAERVLASTRVSACWTRPMHQTAVTRHRAHNPLQHGTYSMRAWCMQARAHAEGVPSNRTRPCNLWCGWLILPIQIGEKTSKILTQGYHHDIDLRL